jgi:hypothetical protein
MSHVRGRSDILSQNKLVKIYIEKVQDPIISSSMKISLDEIKFDLQNSRSTRFSRFINSISFS